MTELQLSFKNISLLLTSIRIILTNLSYLLYIIIAVVVNIIIFIATITFLILIFNTISFRIEDLAGIESNTFISVTLGLVFLLVSIFFSGLIFPTLSSIINSVIYDGLSEKVLKEHNILPKTKRNFIGTIAISIGFEMKKMILAILLLFISSIINLLPGVGSAIYVIISIVGIILINGLDTMNAPLSTQDFKFRQKIEFIFKHPSTWFYLWITATLNAFPVVNIFTIPLTVISSTLVYKEVKDSRN